jgi:hypothetical protein
MLRREYYTCRPGDARLPTPCWEKKREGTIAVYNINSKQLTRTSEEGKQQQQQSKKKKKKNERKIPSAPSSLHFLSLLRSLYKNIVETPY